jgi:hypothetical protein
VLDGVCTASSSLRCMVPHGAAGQVATGGSQMLPRGTQVLTAHVVSSPAAAQAASVHHLCLSGTSRCHGRAPGWQLHTSSFTPAAAAAPLPASPCVDVAGLKLGPQPTGHFSATPAREHTQDPSISIAAHSAPSAAARKGQAGQGSAVQCWACHGSVQVVLHAAASTLPSSVHNSCFASCVLQ